MESIDVRGLPEPIVNAMVAMVEYFRMQTKENPKDAPAKPVHLSVWPGKALGRLTREEIYDDRV